MQKEYEKNTTVGKWLIIKSIFFLNQQFSVFKLSHALARDGNDQKISAFNVKALQVNTILTSHLLQNVSWMMSW